MGTRALLMVLAASTSAYGQYGGTSALTAGLVEPGIPLVATITTGPGNQLVITLSPLATSGGGVTTRSLPGIVSPALMGYPSYPPVGAFPLTSGWPSTCTLVEERSQPTMSFPTYQARRLSIGPQAQSYHCQPGTSCTAGR
jgi:hypothetical protein